MVEGGELKRDTEPCMELTRTKLHDKQLAVLFFLAHKTSAVISNPN